MMNPSHKLHLCIEHALKQFQFVTEDQWNAKPNENKWSKKEVLGHLIDSCITNTRRFIVTQYEQNHTIVYSQNEWVNYQNYQSADYKELIELWRLMNRQLAKTIDHIPAHKLQYICVTKDPHTLEWLIDDYIQHMNHHLKQITG